jgi:hypothetical protein
MNGSAHYTVLRRFGRSFIAAAIGAALVGCHEPDPRTVRGALDAAARALEERDGRALFRVIDQRARSAMASVVGDRREAAELIHADYPAPERTTALASLGDARDATDAADLFTRRCTEPCMAELASAVGAPVAERRHGASDVEVRTARGGRLHLHRGKNGWWGIVWNTAPLSDERTRAARELIQIQQNADVYRRRRALEGNP